MTQPCASPGTPDLVPGLPWRRLDPRMLLVHPVVELVKFLPFLFGIFVLGSNGNQGWWQLLGVAFPIGLGIMRFLTTTFRITPTQIELQRGLIGRKVLTARLDRVRAVELTSTPIHRLLGLAKVEVGTASAAKQGDDKFTLDGLPLEEARHLRVALLHRVDVANPSMLRSGQWGQRLGQQFARQWWGQVSPPPSRTSSCWPSTRGGSATRRSRRRAA